MYFLPSALYASHPHLTDQQRLAFYKITLDGYIHGHLGQALDIYWTKNLSEKNLALWRNDHLAEKMLQMYEFKTASTAVVIAEACCILAGSDNDTRAACRNLARSIGVSFQILNDISNFDEKNDMCGDDLSSGKLTYVIVRAIKRLRNNDRKRLERIICSKRLRRDPASIKEGITLVWKSGALISCRREARSMVREGWQDFSHRIPPSEHKLMLRLFIKTLIGTDNKKYKRPARKGSGGFDQMENIT
jgi:geranylgeranyl pyrophosphate synthase